MNTMLYNGKYLPVTRTIGFVRASIDDYVDHLLSKIKNKYVVDKLYGYLDQGLERLVPIHGPFNGQYVLAQTQNGWTAVFSENGDMMLRLYPMPDSVVFGYAEDSYDFKTNKEVYGYSILGAFSKKG